MLPNLDCAHFKVKCKKLPCKLIGSIQTDLLTFAWGPCGLRAQGKLASSTAQGSSAAEQKQTKLLPCQAVVLRVAFCAHKLSCARELKGGNTLQRTHCIILTRSKAGFVPQSRYTGLFRTMSMMP